MRAMNYHLFMSQCRCSKDILFYKGAHFSKYLELFFPLLNFAFFQKTLHLYFIKNKKSGVFLFHLLSGFYYSSVFCVNGRPENIRLVGDSSLISFKVIWNWGSLLGVFCQFSFSFVLNH